MLKNKRILLIAAVLLTIVMTLSVYAGSSAVRVIGGGMISNVDSTPGGAGDPGDKVLFCVNARQTEDVSYPLFMDAEGSFQIIAPDSDGPCRPIRVEVENMRINNEFFIVLRGFSKTGEAIQMAVRDDDQDGVFETIKVRYLSNDDLDDPNNAGDFLYDGEVRAGNVFVK